MSLIEVTDEILLMDQEPTSVGYLTCCDVLYVFIYVVSWNIEMASSQINV